MHPVNYDVVAPAYDRRYDRNRYDGVRTCLHRFVEGGPLAVAEVGCGTGHWLAELSPAGFPVLAGLDLSSGMLAQARAAVPTAWLVRGRAEQLPWADACLDRLFCVNALHHFRDRSAFVFECRRVLRPGGGLMTIGLDPHRGEDQWWVYDYFPPALRADLLRYPSTSMIRDALGAAGFREPTTDVAEHFHGQIPFEKAREQGFLDRRATSQLMVISDDDYDAGIKRLMAERPLLRSNVRLYATTAWT
jgi:ubiquinone/menaquinone biosynthesis C-methylase UbiE